MNLRKGRRGIIIFVIVTALLVSGFAIWTQLFFDENIPNLIEISDGMSFDFIVVGSGTAGSVVASQLAKNSKSATVLLIEAGDKFGRLSKIPLLTTFLQKTKNDWNFLSTPQKYSSRGLVKKQQSIPRGKGLGGSSQLNYLLHFNGFKNDFDNWKKIGAVDWSYDTMKPYLKNIGPSSSLSMVKKLKSSNLNCCSETETTENSSALNQTNDDNTNPIWMVPKNFSLLTEAFEKAKFEFFRKKLNFQRTQYNVKNGERWNVYQIYLQRAFNLKNFKILLNIQVEKILFENGRAKSVLVRNFENPEGKIVEIHANKEIILSAGAYQTPQILQLSGIGSKEVLDFINIKPIVESKNVGRNLFEHLNLPLYVSISEPASLTLNKIMNPKEVWNYLTKGEGLFGFFGVLGHITKLNENYGITIFGTGTIDESSLKSLSNFKTKTFRSLFPLYYNRNQEGFVTLSTCYKPLSRGTVQAITNQIRHYPLINLNLLDNQYDIECTIKAIRTAIDVILSKSFRRFKPVIHWPILDECIDYGPYTEDFIINKPSDEYLECLIRTVGLSSHHPGGTCAIGNNSDSCVDNKLRVRGVSGLRVVDASVLPAPISGTPNSVLIAVAKRAVDLILNDE